VPSRANCTLVITGKALRVRKARSRRAVSVTADCECCCFVGASAALGVVDHLPRGFARFKPCAHFLELPCLLFHGYSNRVNFFCCSAIADSESFRCCVIVADLAQILAILVVVLRFFPRVPVARQAPGIAQAPPNEFSMTRTPGRPNNFPLYRIRHGTPTRTRMHTISPRSAHADGSKKSAAT